MYSGLIDMPWWGYIGATLVLTHITIVSVTIYLHRYSAHRALELHPGMSHFFRFWLWLTTGMNTKHWTAIHRKHHARCETVEDPHSPQILGIQKVMWAGAELYQVEARNDQTIARFGKGTPDDWLERNVYSSHPILGIGTMFAIDFALFGLLGVTIWAIQMIWIPVFAAGIINGVGHYWGYRSFQVEDASRNIIPWGILIGGEELHNNHHAYPASARLSNQRWEFDIGWMYIRSLELLGLARVKKKSPRVRLASNKERCDEGTLRAILGNRYAVLSQYSRSIKATCRQELLSLGSTRTLISPDVVKRWLENEEHKLAPTEREQLDNALANSQTLQTLHSMRQELIALWQRSNAGKEQLISQLEQWCQRAETSGIAALHEFSGRLRRYELAT